MFCALCVGFVVSVLSPGNAVFPGDDAIGIYRGNTNMAGLSLRQMSRQFFPVHDCCLSLRFCFLRAQTKYEAELLFGTYWKSGFQFKKEIPFTLISEVHASASFRKLYTSVNSMQDHTHNRGGLCVLTVGCGILPMSKYYFQIQRYS